MRCFYPGYMGTASSTVNFIEERERGKVMEIPRKRNFSLFFYLTVPGNDKRL